MTMTFGERVSLLRKRHELTQRQLATAADLDRNTISRLEQGTIQDVNGRAVARLARALKVSADYLLGLTEEAETHELQR